MKKLLILFLPLLMWASTSIALEITNYTSNRDLVSFQEGFFHDVTVAFDDLNKRAKVTCLIKKDGKPIAKQTQWIDGVGTIRIKILGRDVPGKMTASCSESR